MKKEEVDRFIRDIEKVDKKIKKFQRTIELKEVKKSGNGGHIMVKGKYIGKKALVIMIDD